MAQTYTNVGTDFWVAFPPNLQLTAVIRLCISSNVATSGTVQSVFPGVNQNFTVTPGIVTQVTLPSAVVLQSGIEDKGIRIISADPVSVYGLNNDPSSTDAFLALPVSSLGIDYRIITYKTTYANFGSSFSVVATQNGTSLTVFNHQTNSTSSISLNQGQTYFVVAPNNGEDVTGSRIQSNFPVAVFGSVGIGFVPAGCAFADHMIEQMFPTFSWGKSFLTVPLAGRDASGDIFRIVAAEDGTEIRVNGVLQTTINTGDHYEMSAAGYNIVNTTKATMMAQFAKGQFCSGEITGDPFMMLIPPTEQFLTNYTIINVAGVTPFITHWVNVVAPDYALGTIYEDGVLIPTSAFVQIALTNYYGAQRSVTAGSHTYTSTIPFGVYAYGWGSLDSYGYPGGCSISPTGTVNSVTISPPTLSGVLGVSTLCFTAHVTDNLNNPVAGVLVTFNISGISNIIGTAYTDATGDAHYCYTRTGTTEGTDNIYAECFGHLSTTSTAIWTLPPPCANPSGAGTIGASQQGCGSFTPVPLTSLTLPTGETGTLEYKWQQSTTSAVSGFTDIVGTNSPDYSPGLITQTTWYRRVARVSCMADWTGAAITEALEMTVTTPIIPTVTITATQLQVCAGTSVTFTANWLNGGVVPLYQWQVNAVNAINANNAVFTYVPLNGDQVTCVFTSDLPCTANNPAISNTITMTIIQPLLVSVSISATSNPVCDGTPVTFSANPTNPGGTPVYQWKLNDADAGINSQFYTMTPANNDQVKCILTSSMSCVTGNPATSLPIVMNVAATPAVSFINCFDAITTINAKPIRLKGGLPLNGTYSGPGVNSSTGMFTPSVAGIGIKTITYSYTNAALCSASQTQTITVQAVPVFTCGNNLIDIRDNKVYPTVQLGTQCWMQTNLDFGTTINDAVHQTDNCIVEKYTLNSSLLTPNSFYQWDEVMRYDATPGLQGLCPPGWHVPDETEWTILFNYYQGNARAGYPLQDPYLNGFKALQNGVYYLNSMWSFTDFATLFWSSTMADQTRAYAHGMNTIDPSVSVYAGLKANAFSVRCVRD